MPRSKRKGPGGPAQSSKRGRMGSVLGKDRKKDVPGKGFGRLAGARPARLLRKTCLVEASRGDPGQQWWDRLPVYTLTFANPGAPLGVRIDFGDVVKVVVPGVKPKSYSMSRQGEGEFDITYKFYPGGACSSYLHGLAVGDNITCFARGAKRRAAGSHVGIVAFGVGITEGLPVAAAELAKGDAARVKLVWASRTWADTFWHDELRALQAAHPGRFDVVHVLSREARDGCRSGRVDRGVLEAEFDGAWGTAPGGATDRGGCRFLSVGTKPMMRAFDEMIQSLGYTYPAHQLLVR